MTDLAPASTRWPGSDASNVLSAEWLRRRGDQPALILDRPLDVGDDDGRASSTTVTFAELADRVDLRRLAFGRSRRLVQLGGVDDLQVIVTVLAALDGGHPLIVGEPGRSDQQISATFRPDVIVQGRGDAFRVQQLTGWREPSRHDLHPDLAVLMSTSGTTGDAKLVRLSRDAMLSNALAIGESLGLEDRDRAISSLPLHYCYGLSVVTSHLAAEASVVLTNASVVDPCFWSAVERWGVTTLAGVPYTFEMIERLGLDVMRTPSLRLVTQAGGRFEPTKVLSWSEFGQTAGWDFVVMYGQTEATARMAIASPVDTHDHPSSAGRAIPGGSFRIGSVSADVLGDAPPDGAVGEVIYSGPNVMLGYAREPNDLARGRDVDELRTGDLGRLDVHGRLEIVGRASRFVKLHGKRVDLDHLESQLSTPDRPVRCVGDDDGVVAVVVAPDATSRPDDELAREVGELATIPRARIVGAQLQELPRTASGKVDGPAVVAAARATVAHPGPGSGAEAVPDDATVADAFGLVLGLDQVDPAASFADLGGDSFSYVEMSTRLEPLLGRLPTDWHLRSIAELEELRRTAEPRRRWWMQLETGVVIRALAILLIVCTHMRLFRLPGGAHALLALVGYNIARFQLGPSDVTGRLRRSVSTIARVAVPTSVWVGVNMLVVGGYSLGTVLLVNNYTGDAARRDGRWEYWYFEAFVQVMVVVAILFSIPAVRRGERRAPFAFALVVLAVTLLFRFDLVQLGGEYNEMFRTHTVACFVALGWCAQRADSVVKRILVSAAVVATTVGYFGQTDRELRIIAMVLALIWLPSVLVPRALATVITPIAAASMWIFLVHWQVWPLFTPWMHNGVAFWFTIASGVGVWWIADRGTARWGRSELGRRRSQRRTVGRSTSSHVSDADTAISRSDATPVSA